MLEAHTLARSVWLEGREGHSTGVGEKGGQIVEGLAGTIKS